MGTGGSTQPTPGRWRLAAVAAVAALLALGFPGTAASDPAGETDAPSGLEVAAVDTSDYPTVGLTVVARDGTPEPEAIAVTENGEPRPATLTALGDRPLEVVVVLDTSEGVGDELRPAVAAVTEFALRLPTDAEIGVVAAGGEPEVAIAPTGDTGSVLAALAEFEVGGKPAVLAAVPVAVEELSSDPTARRAIVVVTGGARTTEPVVERVVERVRNENAVLFAVAASGEAAGPLAAAGAVVQEIDELSDASSGLRQVAEDLDHLYRLEFTAQGPGPAEVAVSIGDRPAAGAATVALPAGGTPAVAPDRPEPAAEEGLAERLPDRLLWPGYALGSALLLWLAWVVDERRGRSRRRRFAGVERAAFHLTAAARRLVRGRWRRG